MRVIQDDWWHAEFLPAHGPIDYLSRDGKTAVKIEQITYGGRDLHAAVLQMAIYLDQNPAVGRGCIALSQSRLSAPRMKGEWAASKAALQNSIASRLGLAVVENGEPWADPDEPYLRRIAGVLAETSRRAAQTRPMAAPPQAGQKAQEVLKVLLNYWLRKQGPIAIGRLAAEVGCSYPTVRKALSNPSLSPALRSTTNRSIELAVFPHDAWQELRVFSRAARNGFRFRDRSGDRTSPEDLLRRLGRVTPPHVALGGVLAARHWHPDFDLHGTPRLDLTCHAPDGAVDLEFVRKLDPALSWTDDPTAPAALAVHPLTRTAPLFAQQADSGIPWADPVETALDLCDLSLTAQANQLLTHLRPEVRLA